MKPSKYQEAVFKHMASSRKNCAIKAVAGSGKTTTAIKGIGHIDPMESVMLSAFNVDVRDEFKKRGMIEGYRNVSYYNYNGFGHGICCRNLNSVSFLENKTEVVLKTMLKPETPEETKVYTGWLWAAKRLVSLGKNTLIVRMDDALDEIIDHYGIEIPNTVYPIRPGQTVGFRETIVDLYERCTSASGIIDYDDQKYLPVIQGWRIPQFDNVIIDEYQDTSMVEMELMLRAGEKGKVYAIGDPWQAIYGFKGAMQENFDIFVSRFAADVLPLSICYRCDRRIVEEARKLGVEIEARDDAGVGIVEHGVSYDRCFDQVKVGDFVLCRVVADLVSFCLGLMRKGVPSRVRGRELGQGLIDHINQICGDREVSMYEFYKLMEKFVERKRSYYQVTEKFEKLEQLQDRIDSIIAAGDGCKTVYEIIGRITKMFDDTKGRAGTVVDCMTGHKSKGLQAGRVWCLRPDLIPHPMAKKEWMQREEVRLKYVMTTRAERELRWVLKK